MIPTFLDPATLERARSLFPHTARGRIYLNHAGTSPLSTRVTAAVQRHLEDRSVGSIDSYPRDLAMVKELRELVARLINAESPGRIALQINTTEAINIVAAGLPWSAGDRIVLNTIEFPANVYPYRNLLNAGVDIDVLESRDGRITADQIAGALTPRTRLVALSAVQFLSGHRAALATIGEMCRSRGIVFAVDGIQAVGAVMVDVRALRIDALAAGAQKWQMSPHGSGFLYVTEELQARIQQRHLGWLSVQNPWDFHNYDQPLAPTARRYEGGTLSLPSLWGMHAALSTLLEFGPPAIERHILALTGFLHERLSTLPGVRVVTPGPADERAGIVTIALPPGLDGQTVLQGMEKRGVTVALREGMLRFSPHFYNTPQEMATVVDLARECLQ
jgi:selenocysteine lyase/cysteine desulfurase